MNSKKGIEMSISKDLFLALLSMDAYNRGYGAGLELGAGSDVAGSLIGAAKIEKTIKDIPEFATKAEAAGFYAVAYKVGDGVDDIPKDTIVIALRGTDTNRGGTDIGGSDLFNGYGVAIGQTSAPQAELAEKF